VSLALLTLKVLCNINDYKIDPDYKRRNRYNEQVGLETETKELIETGFGFLKLLWVFRPLIGVALAFGWFILGGDEALM